MSHLPNVFPIGHRVYQGGRYLRAFDHAPDIDHFEHSILTFLGSLMPFDKAFVDHPAFPSVLTISSSTRISQSTVRKKLRALQDKGYLKVEQFRFLNERGHFQQSSNNYYLSSLAFEFYDSMLVSKNSSLAIRKRAVGESFFVPIETPSPPANEGVHYSSQAAPRTEIVPNSLYEGPSESPPVHGSSSRNLFEVKREVDNLVNEWETLVQVPVPKEQKAKFMRDYMRTGVDETYLWEKMLPIAADPYVASRAESINYLFNGVDLALKNRDEIVSKATKALKRVDSRDDLDNILNQIPGFIREKSRNYGSVSDLIVKHLLQDPINEAKHRVGVPCDPVVPRDTSELRVEIKRLFTGATEQQQRELAIIEGTICKLSFGRCLNLFHAYRQRHQNVEVVQ